MSTGRRKSRCKRCGGERHVCEHGRPRRLLQDAEGAVYANMATAQELLEVGRGRL
jgi:hypothetical protein